MRKAGKGQGAAGESTDRGKADLVLLPDANGVHPGVPGAAHDIAQVFVFSNLVRCHAHLKAEGHGRSAQHRHGMSLVLHTWTLQYDDAISRVYVLLMLHADGDMRQLYCFEWRGVWTTCRWSASVRPGACTSPLRGMRLPLCT